MYDFFAYLASGAWLLLITGFALNYRWYAMKDPSSLTLVAYLIVADRLR